MRRIWPGLLVMSTLVWPCQTFAQQQGAKVHMHADEGYAADGFLFAPQGQGPFAAVLLIHDSYGLTEYVRTAAKRIAASGKVVVAVDLYRGRNADTAEQAQRLAHDLNDADAMHDLEAAVTFLRSLPTVRGQPIGVAAWGEGAHYASQLINGKECIRAAAMTAVADVDDVRLPAPCTNAYMGSFAGNPSTHARSLEGRLKKVDWLVDFKAYPHAEPRFYDPAGTTFRAEDSADLANRLVRFFDRALATQH